MSTIKNIKMAMNFQAATDRHGCRNCVHTKERAHVSPHLSVWWCSKGDFVTSALAVCAHHQRRQEVTS